MLCFIITAAVDFLRSFNAKQTFDNLIVAYRGMADAFAGVVMLLVAAGVFAQSLSTIGFITNLIASAQSFGGSAFFYDVSACSDYHFSHHGDRFW